MDGWLPGCAGVMAGKSNRVICVFGIVGLRKEIWSG